mmetsp:Transcript_156586/g.284909  ORF Transcript_156586/g.284909 Transcript_156586/m.284909 type:complete len:84 (+) Transcript_156586:239-490(+)
MLNDFRIFSASATVKVKAPLRVTFDLGLALVPTLLKVKEKGPASAVCWLLPSDKSKWCAKIVDLRHHMHYLDDTNSSLQLPRD